MRRLKVLVVDDEPLALRRLHLLLSRIADVDHVVEARDCGSALKLVLESRPDLILLGVGMQHRSDFGLIDRLPSPWPAIVLVSAFGAHACRAFEVGATDFLLKPVTLERLQVAIARVKERRDEQDRSRRCSQLEEMCSSLREQHRAQGSSCYECEFWIHNHGSGQVAALRRFSELYPHGRFPPVTVSIGRGRPVAVAEPTNGINIGLEALCATHFINPDIEDRFVRVMVHEFVHAQQTRELADKREFTVHEASVAEGVAEFVTELLTGDVPMFIWPTSSADAKGTSKQRSPQTWTRPTFSNGSGTRRPRSRRTLAIGSDTGSPNPIRTGQAIRARRFARSSGLQMQRRFFSKADGAQGPHESGAGKAMRRAFPQAAAELFPSRRVCEPRCSSSLL